MGQLAFGNEPDPATVIWSTHAGFFWRALTSLYAAIAIGFVAHAVADANEARLVRWLVRAITLSGFLAAFQASFFP
jgi:hypothetical protein